MWCLLGQHYESQDNEMLHVASKPQSPGGSGENAFLASEVSQGGVSISIISRYRHAPRLWQQMLSFPFIKLTAVIPSSNPSFFRTSRCVFLGEHFSDAEKLSSLVVCGSYSVYLSPPSSGYILANTLAWSFLTVRKTSPKNILIEGLSSWSRNVSQVVVMQPQHLGDRGKQISMRSRPAWSI